MWPFDQNNQPMYQQYAQAYETGNYNDINQYQAAGQVQQFMQNAPPEMQHQVYQQHFEQMPYDQRVQFAQQMPPQYPMDPNNPYGMAQSFRQMGQEQPGMLSQMLGQGGPLGNMMGQGGIGSLAGLIARHVLGNRGGGIF